MSMTAWRLECQKQSHGCARVSRKFGSLRCRVFYGVQIWWKVRLSNAMVSIALWFRKFTFWECKSLAILRESSYRNASGCCKNWQSRGWTYVQGTHSLPVPQEVFCNQKREMMTLNKTLKAAQSDLGSLMWLGLRSRPDICAVIGTAACLVATNPNEARRICTGIWKYLRGTVDWESCTSSRIQ